VNRHGAHVALDRHPEAAHKAIPVLARERAQVGVAVYRGMDSRCDTRRSA